MGVIDNVIHVDPATFYCMRQCRESISYLSTLVDKKPIYQTEINGEKELYRHYMNEALGRAA